MRAVKFATPFLLLSAFALTACQTDTLATNRRLYRPQRGSGPYTESRETGLWRRGEYRAPRVEKKEAAPAPPIETTTPEVVPPAA